MIYLYLSLAVVAGIIAVALITAWRIMVWMPGRSFRGQLPPLDEREKRVRDRLRNDLQRLSGDIGPRNVSHQYDGLLAAAEFIEQSLVDAGYETSDQAFDVDGQIVRNIAVEIQGSTRPDEVLVVGAHYDTIPNCPGANDNGSAVVANLALARSFSPSNGAAPPERTIRFVFFVNEERPYYGTESMGSLRYAQKCQADGDKIIGMICLETIGYYSNTPGSQRYPTRWLGYLYPTTGNFITVVGNIASRRFVHQVIRGLRRTAIPSQGMAAPHLLKDIFRSDHASFWRCGYPALMITDTANFRYAHYHTPEDTVDKVDFQTLARLISAIEASVMEVAGGETADSP